MGRRQLATDFQLRERDVVLVDNRVYHFKEAALARMHNPPYPGATLREDVLPALGLSVTEAARQLGVSRVALSRVLNGRAGISPSMARRIEAWLGPERGGDAEAWLRMQLAYDLWRERQRPAPKVRRAPKLAQSPRAA